MDVKLDAQIMVEQDLVISRILVELFSDPFLRGALVFRSGTVAVAWQAVRLKHYRIDCTPSLKPAQWTPAAPAVQAMTDGPMTWTGQSPALRGGGYYRVVVLPD